MKMKMFCKIKLSFLWGAAILTGCNQDPAADAGPDIQKPQISMLSSSPESAEGIICKTTESHVISAITGSEIVLKLEFVDDRELSQYKVDIHNNFDCHSHGRAAPWQLLKVVDIEGVQVALDENLLIPADASAGNYHLQILCLDKAGNEAEPLIYSMKLENSVDSISPELFLSEPSTEQVKVMKGADLRFKGMVLDNHSLGAGKIEITYTEPDGTVFFPIQEFFPEGQGLDASFDLQFKVPIFASSGIHEFFVKAYDTFNNSVEEKFKVEFE